MFVKNRFRPGKPYFHVARKGGALDISQPPEIWLCESGISRDCTPDGCSRCGIDLIFVRLSPGGQSMSRSDRVQFTSEFDAAQVLMTWNEFVEACLFTWRATENEKVRPESPLSPDSPPIRAFVGGEKTTYHDLLSQCEGKNVETVSITFAKSSGFAAACPLVPGMIRLHVEKTPLSCAEFDPISKVDSLRVLTIRECPLVRSSSGRNDRLTDDVDAGPHECLGRTCLTRSFQRLARTLKGLYCRDVKIRDQDLWGFDSNSSIESLMLAGSKVTDQSAPRLGVMQKLRWVDLSDSRITDEAVIALCRNNPLDELNLSRTRVSDRVVDQLIEASQLRSLFLRGTNVSRNGLRRLRDEMPECRLQM